MSDFTKDQEAFIDEQVEAGREYMKKEMPRYRRPLYTEKVSKDDQRFDFNNRQGDYWQAMNQTAMQQTIGEGGNLGDVLIALLKHDQEMRDGS